MSVNKLAVERYMDGFRRTDREQILGCLTDDVVWTIPGAFDVRGKAAFAGHIVDEGFVPPPEITVDRLTEEGDVVIAEGSVRARRTDGSVLSLAFCDVFELRGGLISRLVSYLVPLAAETSPEK